MIYSLNGNLSFKGDNFAVIEVGDKGGIGFKVFLTKKSLENLPSINKPVKVYCFLQVKEDTLGLYGFLSVEEKNFFELLISVNGVGPKSALSILETNDLSVLKAAIIQNRADLLTKASGIGLKTAQRIILELKNKIISEKSEEKITEIENRDELIEGLAALGYKKKDIELALLKTDKKISFEERLKQALKILSGK
jgi:Holliday junction DNA helicase RuvA